MFRDLQNAEQNILNESTFLEKRIEIKKVIGQHNSTWISE